MANYRIRYTVKNVFQILEDNFHTEQMSLLLLHIISNFGRKHGKT